MSEEEIRVQGENYLGSPKLIMRLDDFSESEPRTFAHVVARERLELMPFGLGEFRQQRLQLRRQRGRRDCAGKHPQPHALLRLLGLEGGVNGREKRAPSAYAARLRHGLGTVGVIQIEDGRLVEHTRRAAVRGVRGVAFDLRGVAFVAFHQEAGGEAVLFVRGRKEERLAGHHFLRLFDVGNNGFNRLPRAAYYARQGH